MPYLLLLLDYAAVVMAHNPTVGNDVLAVFFIYNQLEYSSVLPTAVQARIALGRAEKIHDQYHNPPPVPAAPPSDGTVV